MTNRLEKLLLLGLMAGLCSCREAPQPVPLLVIAGPRELVSIEVRSDADEPIWRLEAESSANPSELIYGMPPVGFRQTVPEAGLPRPFELGELLVIESSQEKRRFLHTGIASSESTMAILSSEIRHEPAPDRPKEDD